MQQYYCKSFNEYEYSIKDKELEDYLIQTYSSEWISLFKKIIKTPPLHSTLRLNTFNTKKNDFEFLKKDIMSILKLNDVIIKLHELMDDCVVMKRKESDNIINRDNIKVLKKFVIVDDKCGVSVLRGANVFTAGVVGMIENIRKNDNVSVLCNIDKNSNMINQGEIMWIEKDKKRLEKCVHIGNGKFLMTRSDVFKSKKRGIAVEMKEHLFPSNVPMNEFNKNEKYFGQNEPSMFVSHLMNPKRGMKIVDLCAAPGGKTTHLANLMNNEGSILAFDKRNNKINRIKKNQKIQNLTIISAKKQDATQATSKYEKDSFDMVLCDVPCSGLGKRPQFIFKTTLEEIKSLSLYQRRIFIEGYKLLKPGGIICYSTCSICPLENEENMNWFLSNLQGIKPFPITINHNSSSSPFTINNNYIKFDPTNNPNYNNSPSFFISLYTKQPRQYIYNMK